MTNTLKFKRIMAYFVDILVVSLLVYLLSNINFLNPQRDKYKKVLLEYNYYMNDLKESLGNSTLTEMDNIATDEYVQYMYDLQYYGMSYTIIEIATILLYFTLFPKFNHNQTIGKSLLKIKIVNADGTENISIWKYLFRSALLPIFTSIILYVTFSSFLNFAMLFVLKPRTYLYTNIGITLVFCILCYADVIFMLANKDSVSLHDRITKTRVIEKC